jgi:acetyl-CoA carboxylase carboxyl transferase subunit alpha
MMFEHSVYTVATPEACAAILWRDAGKSAQAAAALKIEASDLKQLGIVDHILPEPTGGAHRNPLGAAQTLKQAILQALLELSDLSPTQRRNLRYEKFRQIGQFAETSTVNTH